MESGGFIRKNERRPSRGTLVLRRPERSGDNRTSSPDRARKKRPIGVPPISLFFQSARRESNPRPPPWQGGAPPLSHSRIVLCKLSVALTSTSSILLHVPGNVNSFLNFFYIFLLILFFCVPLFALRLNTFLSALTVFTIATVNAAVCTVSTRT